MERHPYITTNLMPTADRELVFGRGVHVGDSENRQYLDLTCQTLNLALGHGNRTVRERIVSQLQHVWFASSRFGSEPFIELSKRLVALAPQGISAVNLKLCNGSDAVETAVKIARLHTRERAVICIRNGWHGESNATLGLCSVESKKSYITSETDVIFSQEPTLESLARTIDQTPYAAAVLIDPVGVSNGVFREEDMRTWLPVIRTRCSQRGILLIFDEIQTFGGFLGTHLFASDFVKVFPDIICLGKALGAGLPLAATLCTSELRGVLDYNNAEYTSGGQAVPCAAALGALDEYERRSKEFEITCKKWQEVVKKYLGVLPQVTVHTVGFFVTCMRKESVFRDVWAKEVEHRALKAGLIVRRNDQGQRILLKPPLIISSREARRACIVLAQIMSDVEKQLKREPVRLVRGKHIAGTHKNEWYAHMLLSALGEGFGARTSTAQEQHMLSERLQEIGVSTARVYAAENEKITYAFQEGEPAHEWLRRTSKEFRYGEVNAFFVRQQNAVELAHDHGIIIGDRWPGNTIVQGERCIFIDYDILYEGEFRKLAAFEELFCLFQSLAYVADTGMAERIAKRFVRGIVRRHGKIARDIWSAMYLFYMHEDKPQNSMSLSTAIYKQLALMIEKNMSKLHPKVYVYMPELKLGLR